MNFGDIYKSIAWQKKQEVIDLFDGVTPKFLKETAHRVFLEVGIKDEVNGRKIDIYTPSKFIYVEDYSYNRWTLAEYVVYDESHWDPFTVTMTPNEITLERYNESSHEKELLFSATWNIALMFYFQQYMNIVVTDEEIEEAKKKD